MFTHIRESSSEEISPGVAAFFKTRQTPVVGPDEDEKFLKWLEEKGLKRDKEVIKKEFWPKEPDVP
jgi:hypothetical protein